MIKTHERQTDVWKVVTPKVLETVREQFACEDLNGAELENNVRSTSSSRIPPAELSGWCRGVQALQVHTGRRESSIMTS